MPHQKVASIQVAYIPVICPNIPDHPSFSRMTVQQEYPNKTAVTCNWRSPNNNKITTVEEAQELAAFHFAVCITNPEVIQRKRERQTEADHNCQRDNATEGRAADAQAANAQRAVDQRNAPKLQPQKFQPWRPRPH